MDATENKTPENVSLENAEKKTLIAETAEDNSVKIVEKNPEETENIIKTEDSPKNQRDNEKILNKSIELGRDIYKETSGFENSFRNRATAIMALSGAFMTFFIKDFSLKYKFAEIEFIIPSLYFCTLFFTFSCLILTFICCLTVVLPQILPFIDEDILNGQHYNEDSNVEYLDKVNGHFHDVIFERSEANEKLAKRLFNAYIFMFLTFIFGIVNVFIQGV